MKLFELVKLVERERNSRIDKKNPSSRFIFRAYTNIIAKLKETFNEKETITEKKIDTLPITDGMKIKLKKMLKLSLKKVSAKQSKESLLKEELSKYLGLGKTKIKELMDAGLKSCKDLKQKKWQDKLPLETRVMLKYKPLRKIPHEEIKKMEPILTKSRNFDVYLAGSYRRKTKFSRDIDIMLVPKIKDKSEFSQIDTYLKYLEKHFNIIIYNKGKDKASFLIKKGKKVFKVDVFITPKKYSAAMLLYSTGSKMFNIKMRAKAKAKGYLLNQKGLYSKKTNKILNIKSEEEFFERLGMEYIEPENRK